jgi:hypothetical protein
VSERDCDCCDLAAAGPPRESSGAHVHGELARDGWEVRYQADGRGVLELDEVVARAATVHLEQMSEEHWWLGIELPDGTAIHVSFARMGKRVAGVVTEIDRRAR